MSMTPLQIAEKALPWLVLSDAGIATDPARRVKTAPPKVREQIGRSFTGRQVKVTLDRTSLVLDGTVTAVAINMTSKDMADGLVLDRPGRSAVWVSLAQVASIEAVV